MRIGLLADLHFGIDPWVDRQVERFIEARVGPAACDGLLIAGDVAEMAGLIGADLGRRHRSLLARLKTVVAGPVGFCAGNHDLWSSDAAIDSWRIYQEVLAEVAARTGTVYLDAENLRLGGVACVGCYGHFDFSLRVPDLTINGRRVADADYRRQTPPGYPEPVWRDGSNLRWEFDDPGACAAICAAGRVRLEAALAESAPGGGASPARQIVLLSHGVPRHEVNGHRANREPVSQFLNAFSGTQALETLVRRAVASGARVLSVSGHTHKSVPRVSLEGADYVNVGGTYGEPRLVVTEFAA